MSNATTTRPTPVVAETENEFYETLTGYEEQAIASAFASQVELLPMTTARRAMIFIDRLRKAGATSTDPEARKSAKQHVMGLTVKQASDYFADESDPDSDDETGATSGEVPPAPQPVTPASYDELLDEPTPTNSPTSA